MSKPPPCESEDAQNASGDRTFAARAESETVDHLSLVPSIARRAAEDYHPKLLESVRQRCSLFCSSTDASGRI